MFTYTQLSHNLFRIAQVAHKFNRILEALLVTDIMFLDDLKSIIIFSRVWKNKFIRKKIIFIRKLTWSFYLMPHL